MNSSNLSFPNACCVCVCVCVQVKLFKRVVCSKEKLTNMRHLGLQTKCTKTHHFMHSQMLTHPFIANDNNNIMFLIESAYACTCLCVYVQTLVQLHLTAAHC